MLNRRTFLKTGAAVIPMTVAALNALDNASTFSAEEVAVATVSASTPSSCHYLRGCLRSTRSPNRGSRRFAASDRAT